MSLETNHEYINQTLGQEKTIKNPKWRNERNSGKSVASDVVHQIGINTKTVRLELESLQTVEKSDSTQRNDGQNREETEK